MALLPGGRERSPDAIGVADGYCPIHRGVHVFEIIATHAGTRLEHARLPNGVTATHGLRSPLACAVQRPVDLRTIEATTAGDRWKARLDTEALLREDPTSVPLEERLRLLRETAVELDLALVPPADKANRVIARHLGAAIGIFVLLFGLLVTTHVGFFAYVSVLSLVVCVLVPFVSKGLFARTWRRNVLELVPGAIGPLGLTTSQVKTEIVGARPKLRRLARRRTLQRILRAAHA
ncbi:MAG: hypothetical protein R2706_15480 [Acidimicrobiales bacterium]